MSNNDIESKSKDNNNTLNNYNLGKFVESALLIAIFTAVFYCFGWAHTDGFLRRLGLTNKLIEFSNTYYIMDSYLGIGLALLFYFVGHYGTGNIENRKLQAFRRNIFILFYALVILFLSFQDDAKEMFYFLVGFSILSVGIYLFTSINQYDLLPNSLIGKFGLGIIIFLSSLVGVAILGMYHAKYTIEGKLSTVTQIQLKTKQDIPQINLENKYILLFHNDNKYFITKQENIAPEFPIVYIIPDDEVEFAIINKLNQGN